MRNFSDKLNSENKKYFPSVYKLILKQKLRTAITEHIVSHDEDSYFSLDEIKEKLNVKNMKLVKDCVVELVSELKKLNWKCAFSYGGTALFIYSSENPPSNCYSENNTFIEQPLNEDYPVGDDSDEKEDSVKNDSVKNIYD